MWLKRRSLVLAVGVLALGMGQNAPGADDYGWTGGGAQSNFDNTFNWDLLVFVPTSADTIRFDYDGSLRQRLTVNSDRTVNKAYIQGQSLSGSGPYEWENTQNFALNITNGLYLQTAVNAPAIYSGLRLLAIPITTNRVDMQDRTRLILDNTAVLNAASVAMVGDSSIAINNSTINLTGFGTFSDGKINVNNLGALNTPQLNLYSGAQVFVNSGGRLNLNTANSGSTLISNGALLSVLSGGTMTMSTNNKLRLENSGHFNITPNWTMPDTTTVDMKSGSSVYADNTFNLGNGTLFVDTSAFTANAGISSWGQAAGQVAMALFLNDSAGSLNGGLRVGVGGGKASVGVSSRSLVNVGSSLVTGDSAAATTVATLSLSGGTLNSNGTSQFNKGTLIDISNQGVDSGGLLLNGNATLSAGATLNWNAGGSVKINSTLTIDGGALNSTIGGSSLASGGTVRIINGGSFNATSYFDIANLPGGGTGQLIIEGLGSKLTSGGVFTDWGNGAAGSTATISISNSGAATYSTGLQIGKGADAFVTISSNGHLNVDNFLNIGGAPNPFFGANVTINAAALKSTGTMTMGSKSSVNVIDGSLGVATLVMSGGSLTNGATLTLANSGMLADYVVRMLGGSTFTLSGSASATLLGGVDLATTGGRAVFNQIGTRTVNAVGWRSGGAVDSQAIINITSGNMSITGVSSFDSGSTINLSGGTLELGNATFAGGSRLNWTGGTLSMTPLTSLTLNGSTASVSVGGGLSHNTSLWVINGGAFNTSSWFDIGNSLGAGASGQLVVDGAGSKFTANVSSDWGKNVGDYAAIYFQNGGVGTYSGVNHRIGISGGESDVNLLSGGTLNINGNLSVGPTAAGARIHIDGGALRLNGSAASFNSGASVSFVGGTFALANGGTFFPGSLLYSTTSTPVAVASGKTLAFDGGDGTFATGTSLAPGATLKVLNGGVVTAGSYFDIAVATGGASGTLDVRGVGSSFASGDLSDWGNQSGDHAYITFQNHAVGTISRARVGLNGGTADVYLEDHAVLNIGTLTTAGAYSYITAYGNSELNIANDATFGAVNVSQLVGSHIRFGGNTTFLPGTAYYDQSGPGVVEIASGKTLAFNGALVTIDSDKNLSAGGNLSIGSGAFANLSGPLHITNGSLTVKDPDTTFHMSGTPAYWASGPGLMATVNFSNSSVGTFDGEFLMGFGGSGTAVLNVNSNAQLTLHNNITIGGTSIVNLNSGTINSDGIVYIGDSGRLNYAGGTLKVAGLYLSTNGRLALTPGGNKVVQTKDLTLFPTASIDLSNNKAIWDYTAPLQPVFFTRFLIGKAYNNGAWSGLGGIATSMGDATHGLGYADNTMLGLSNFGGVAVDADSILIKYTYYGDGNLDGKVDIRDLYLLASHYQSTGTVWTSGDFNYDGKTDVKDFTLLATNWQAGVGAPLATTAGAALATLGFPSIAVPEPGAVACLSGMAVFLGRRRCRHRRRNRIGRSS